MLSADHLVKPLRGLVIEDFPDWEVEPLLGEDATKANLLQVLGGDRTPSILFTATHGMVFDDGDPRQVRHQGALMCQDWPGPLAFKTKITEDHYFSRDDVSSGAKLKAPDRVLLRLLRSRDAAARRLRPQGRRLPANCPTRPGRRPAPPAPGLARRRGPGRGRPYRPRWSFSFLWGRAGEQLDTYQQALVQLFAGFPVGAALEAMNAFYASISTMLVNEIDDIKHKKIPDDMDLSGLWTAHNDARNFVLLGDPAVRLPQGAGEGD